MNEEQQELINIAYEEYRHSFKDYWSGKHYDIPVITTFIYRMKHQEGFFKGRGLKIEERELSLEERYGLVRVNGLCPKYSFEIEDGKPTQNKMSESEWYDNHNIPTKLITLTYNDKIIESHYLL